MVTNRKTKSNLSTADFLIKKTSGKGKIVITKKVAQKSVDRNRIKRITKEALRSLNLRQLDFLIIIRRNIADLKTSQLKQKIERILMK